MLPSPRREILCRVGAAFLTLALARSAGAQSAGWLVGQIGPLDGPTAVPAVIQLGEGMKAAFAATNRRGGVDNKLFNFYQFDDKGDSGRFVQQVQEAQRRQTLALLSVYGSPAVRRMLDEQVLEHSEMVVINAIPGAEAFRKPGNPRLFHVRAGDGQQVERVLQHVATLGHTSVAVLYVDAPGGHSGLASAQAAALRPGAVPGLLVQGFKATHEAAASMALAAQSLSASTAKCVLLIGPPQFLIDAVLALRGQGVHRPIYTLSYLNAEDLHKAAGAAARGVAIAQTFPNPMGLTLAVQQEFRSAMRALHPAHKAYTAFHFEGYISARVFIEAARRSRGSTAAEVARALRGAGDIDLGGFRVNFSQGNVGSHFVDIGVVNEVGRLVY
jgi:ABC-type branched-subunit amino acid transport system substrate-binding protein